MSFALRIGEKYLPIDSDTPFDRNEPVRSEMFLQAARVPFSRTPRWARKWLTSSVYNIAKLPGTVCLECTVFGTSKSSQQREVISAVKFRLFDMQSRMLEGQHSFRMWGREVVDRSYEYVLTLSCYSIV